MFPIKPINLNKINLPQFKEETKLVNRFVQSPTYSLTLRGQIGRKLTPQEMDGNFLYLQSISGATGPSGSIPVFNQDGIPAESNSGPFIRQDNLYLNLMGNQSYLMGHEMIFDGRDSYNSLAISTTTSELAQTGVYDTYFLDPFSATGSVVNLSFWQGPLEGSSAFNVTGRLDFITGTTSYGNLGLVQATQSITLSGQTDNLIVLEYLEGGNSGGGLAITSDFNSLSRFSIPYYLQNRKGVLIISDDLIALQSNYLLINGATGYSGTFSTGDSQIATFVNGILVSLV